VLLLFAMMSFGGGNEEPLYALRQSRSFSVARETSRWNEAPPEPAIVAGLPYFVRDHVAARLRTDQALLWTVERGVQADLKRFWGASCREEEAERRELEARVAGASGGTQRSLYQRRLNSLTAPGCDNLRRFFGAGGGAKKGGVGGGGSGGGGGGGARSDEFA